MDSSFCAGRIGINARDRYRFLGTARSQGLSEFGHDHPMAKLHIGLSGFAYKEWQGKGRFYPPELKPEQYFDYYVSRYNALEADGTWYQMPKEAAVEKWVQETPAGFRFSPKMHRKITHMTRLKPEGIDALNFFLKRLAPLEAAGKLGGLLVQLPPNLQYTDDRLATFLAAIPHRESLPWCLEFRNDSWHMPEVEALLREHNVAWVGWDTDEADAQRRDTAGHIYVRMRRSDYSDDQLKEWSDYFSSKLNQRKDCYVYCKHEDAEQPWVWADRIRELVERASGL